MQKHELCSLKDVIADFRKDVRFTKDSFKHMELVGSSISLGIYRSFDVKKEDKEELAKLRDEVFKMNSDIIVRRVKVSLFLDWYLVGDEVNVKLLIEFFNKALRRKFFWFMVKGVSIALTASFKTLWFISILVVATLLEGYYSFEQLDIPPRYFRDLAKVPKEVVLNLYYK